MIRRQQLTELQLAALFGQHLLFCLQRRMGLRQCFDPALTFRYQRRLFFAYLNQRFNLRLAREKLLLQLCPFPFELFYSSLPLLRFGAGFGQWSLALADMNASVGCLLHIPYLCLTTSRSLVSIPCSCSGRR